MTEEDLIDIVVDENDRRTCQRQNEPEEDRGMCDARSPVPTHERAMGKDVYQHASEAMKGGDAGRKRPGPVILPNVPYKAPDKRKDRSIASHIEERDLRATKRPEELARLHHAFQMAQAQLSPSAPPHLVKSWLGCDIAELSIYLPVAELGNGLLAPELPFANDDVGPLRIGGLELPGDAVSVENDIGKKPRGITITGAIDPLDLVFCPCVPALVKLIIELPVWPAGGVS